MTQKHKKKEGHPKLDYQDGLLENGGVAERLMHGVCNPWFDATTSQGTHVVAGSTPVTAFLKIGASPAPSLPFL